MPKFQLMPPRGGNRHTPEIKIQGVMFQLMPPRGGNLFSLPPLSFSIVVSTHAPARGQSIHLVPVLGVPKSFNSCPREGAIVIRNLRLFAALSFQLMPPRGGNQM